MAQQNNFIVDLIANLNTTLFNRQMRNLQNQRYNVNVGVNNNSLKNTHAQMRQLGTATQNTNSVFGKLKNTLSNTFSAGRLSMTGFLAVLNEINKAGRNAKETIKEIDKAVTDLSVATNMSREAVSGLVKEYNSYAKDLKSTTTQITDAADDYLRAGKTMSEAQKLIKSSIMLSKLGQIDSGEATEDLLATMNGFNMSVEEVGKALDAMVAIDMKAATSSGDIATALKYCASSADMAGVSFSKLAAMIGTVQDKTQQSAETVGTFMNTLLSRYRNVKIGQFVSDEGEDLSEVETILKSLDLKLRNSNQEFRNFEVVLDEVASKWNTYSSVQQAAIAKAFSGTRQQNRFIALMEGYNKTLELTEVAANSAGTAVEKFNKSYADSLEAKKNTLQASFESLIMNSDLDKVYSGILEATNALVQFINKANALKGVFTSLAVTGGIKAFMSIKTGVTQAYIALNQFQQALNLVKQPKIATNDFTRLLMLTKNLSASQMKLILSSKSLTLTQKKQLLMNQGLSESEARLVLQNMKLKTSYTGLKAALVSVGDACKGFLNTLKANPIFLVATAVSMATMAWQSYKQKIEEIRQKTVELTNSYKEQQDSLDSQIVKYKELKDSLDKGNLSTDESRSIKEQLLEIQKSLIESYGNEASNIDLVNGKYKEQLGLLSELSKEKATDYVTENRDVFADAKEALEKIREYELGTVTSWSSYAPETEEQKRLVEYLETYSDFLELTKPGSNYGSTYATSVSLSVKANVENADEIMHQLAEDLEKYGKDNNIDVSGLLEGISEQLKKTWTDELTDYKTIYDEFMKAEIIRNDTLRPLYQQSIKAVEDYNSALSTGEGVEKAKANLDSVQQSVQNATGELEGSQDVFDGIYDGINKDAEAVYNLGQAFENDKTVQNYAEQLRGLMDIDLKAINFKDTVEQPGEKAFTALMDYLGYTEDQVQMLIDKLVEFGYVQGEIQDTASDISAPFTKSEMISAINEMSEGFEELDKIFESISDKDPFDFKLLDDKAFKETFSGLDEEYTNFIETISSTPDDINACKSAFNDLVGAWIKSTGILDKVDESTAKLTISMLKMMGVANAEEIVTNALTSREKELNAEKIVLEETSKTLTSVTGEEIIALQNEGDVSKETAQEMTLFALQKQAANLTTISTDDDISNLNSLCTALIATGYKCIRLNELVNLLNGETVMPEERRKNIISAIQSEIDDIMSGKGINLDIPVDYTGGNKSNKTSSKKEKDTTKEFNWIENAISSIEKRIKSLQQVIDSAFSTTEAKTKALKDQIALINQEIELQQKAYETYMAKAESVGLSDKYKNLVQNGDFSIEDITDKDLQEAISKYQDYYDKAQDTLDKINELHDEARQKHVDGYELEAEELKGILNSQGMTEKQYLDKMEQLWKKYFENQVEYAEVAKNKKLTLLEEEKSYLQSVANAAIKLLDMQIDELEDQKDAAVQGLKDQIDAIEKQKKALELLKKPLQDQLDMMETAQTREERILAVQKAQYELRRAESQRNQFKFVDGQMIYTTDDKAIKDARNDLDTANYELTKFNIQQQIEAINKQIEGLDEQIDKINEIIDETERFYDEQIKGIQKYKDEWQKAIDLEELAINMQNFIDKFGENGIAKLLTGDMSLIQDWKQSYIDTLAEIDITSTGTIGDITTKFGELAGIDLSPTVRETLAVQSQVDQLRTSVNDTSSAVNGDSDSLTSAINEEYNVASEKIPAETQMMGELADITGQVSTEVNFLSEAINNLPEEKTVKIVIETEGELPNLSSFSKVNVSAKAFSDGTDGLKHDEKNALRSEYGQPELTAYPNGDVVLTTEPIMSDLPKGTVVYNEEQTKQIMSNNGETVVGKSYANGTPIIKKAPLPVHLRPIQEGDEGYELIKKAELYFEKFGNQIVPPVNAIDKNMEMMARNISYVNNNNNSVNSSPTINMTVNCPGITSKEVANQVSVELERAVFGLSNKALQRANITR